MDDVHTHCRARGADGVAFVLQGQSAAELGEGGAQMGYGGIPNSLAVEFDTWYNTEAAGPGAGAGARAQDLLHDQ